MHFKSDELNTLTHYVTIVVSFNKIHHQGPSFFLHQPLGECQSL